MNGVDGAIMGVLFSARTLDNTCLHRYFEEDLFYIDKVTFLVADECSVILVIDVIFFIFLIIIIFTKPCVMKNQVKSTCIVEIIENMKDAPAQNLALIMKNSLFLLKKYNKNIIIIITRMKIPL